MTQAERGAVDRRPRPDHRPTASARCCPAAARCPTPNTPTAWADMVDGFQQAALSTRLRHPDHLRRRRRARAQQRLRRNDLPAQHRPRRHPGPGLVAAGRGASPPRRSRGHRHPQWDFAPCLCVRRDDRWGRTYESFGEDPALVSMMETAASSACRAPGSVSSTATTRCWPPPSTSPATATPIRHRRRRLQDRPGRHRSPTGRTSHRIDLRAVPAGDPSADVGCAMPSFSSVDWTEDGVGNPIKMHAEQ